MKNITFLTMFMVFNGGLLHAQRTAVIDASNCPATISRWWQQHGQGGKIVCGKDATRPAVLLLHGLHADARSWTAPSYAGLAFDYRTAPVERQIGDTHAAGNQGWYEASVSNTLYGGKRADWDKLVNWFDFLVSRGFTVATWDQPDLAAAASQPAALEAFDSLLAHTQQLNPRSPPRVALIGHGRGGLLVRHLLKERPSNGRVEWAVTLHSPHKGSAAAHSSARLLSEAVDLVHCCLPAGYTAHARTTITELMVRALQPLTLLAWPAANSELTPDGETLRRLAAGERAIAGVKYYTFGGTIPTYYKIYTWFFAVSSSEPQYKDGKQYFVWTVRPTEMTTLSPLLDKVRDFMEEVKPGIGDGLVTNASARMPWSTHTTTQLNHTEVLWNRPLQQRVAQLLTQTTRAPGRTLVR